MEQQIIGFHLDELDDWVAELACGHGQHVRHNPPWIIRTWVTSESGRNGYIGERLNCLKCDRGEPVDDASGVVNSAMGS